MNPEQASSPKDCRSCLHAFETQLSENVRTYGLRKRKLPRQVGATVPFSQLPPLNRDQRGSGIPSHSLAAQALYGSISFENRHRPCFHFFANAYVFGTCFSAQIEHVTPRKLFVGL
jgi:hypothetical protein